MPATETILPLYPGAWLLRGSFGGRPLALPLLAGGEGLMLIDTGSAGHAENLVLPSLKQLGFSPGDVRWIVTTHCDVDHQGGNHRLKRAAPRAILACGDADREQVESPASLMRLRYEFYREDHALFYNEAEQAGILAESGAPQPMDLTLVGGETIRIGAGRDLQVLHLPGHSRGHLGILDVAHRTLFGGDAIQGEDYRSLQGDAALCPTYLYPSPYLETIRRIESLNVNRYCGCHWPMMEGAAIQDFCAASRRFVEHADHLVRASIESSGKTGVTLRELCESLGPRLGRWPAAVHLELRYALHGHLGELVVSGAVRRIETARPVRYACARFISSA